MILTLKGLDEIEDEDLDEDDANEVDIDDANAEQDNKETPKDRALM